MKFADFVCKKAIAPQLQADDKSSVITELVTSLVDAGQISPGDKDEIINAVMEREKLGSTGIGRGVAVPHTKHAVVDKLVGTVGVSADGIDFNSLDGENVQLFFLLVSPPDRPGDHLRALENITRHLRENEMFLKFLKQSKTAEDIQQLLEEADNSEFVSES